VTFGGYFHWNGRASSTVFVKSPLWFGGGRYLYTLGSQGSGRTFWFPEEVVGRDGARGGSLNSTVTVTVGAGQCCGPLLIRAR